MTPAKGQQHTGAVALFCKYLEAITWKWELVSNEVVKWSETGGGNMHACMCFVKIEKN